METRPLLRDELTGRLREFVLEQRTDVPVRISTERELADRLGVSRISVRHALKNLVTEGLLVQKQGSGTYIVPTVSIRAVQVLLASGIKPNDPFYNEFLAEFSQYCTENSIQLEVSREGSNNGLRDVRSPLVIVGLVGEKTLQWASSTDRLVVSTQYYPDFLDITQLLFDDFRIGWEAAEILHSYGHSRVIHLRGPRVYPSAEERAKGFEVGADRKKLTVVTLLGKMNWRSGHQLGEEVLRLIRERNPPTAVFASNDWMALGLMHRLAEARVSVPTDLSIVGCDNIHMAAEIAPGLSTFKWDMNYMVRELFSVINAESVAKSRTHKRILLPASFIARDSLARLDVKTPELRQ